jgi:hypothetical protein
LKWDQLGLTHPSQRVRIVRQRRAEFDLDVRADRMIDRYHLDHASRSVRLRAKHNSPIAGSDDERAIGSQYGTGHDAQSVADCATLRQSQRLARTNRTTDAEEIGDLVRRAVDAGTVV